MSNPTPNSTASIAVLAGVLALSGAAAMAAPTTVVFEQMNVTKMPSAWAMGSQSGATLSVSTDTSQNLKGSAGSLKATYPKATGSVYAWAVYYLSDLKTNEIYLDFWAKMPGAKQGLKFLKVFGGHTNGNTGTYANTTMGTDYTGSDYGSIYQVGFGDGATTGNDYGNAINFDGAYPSWIGRSYGKGATVLTPQKKGFSSTDWGTGWHHFKVRIKFNSGTTAANEVNDGAYYVEIDDKVYVDAKGLFNRHYSNAPIDRVEFFGWAQTGTAPFEIWYDDIRITTGGFIDGDTKVPVAPGQVVAE